MFKNQNNKPSIAHDLNSLAQFKDERQAGSVAMKEIEKDYKEL